MFVVVKCSVIMKAIEIRTSVSNLLFIFHVYYCRKFYCIVSSVIGDTDFAGYRRNVCSLSLLVVLIKDGIRWH